MVNICRLCLKSYPKSRPELTLSVTAKDQNGLAVTTLMKTLIPEVYLGVSEAPLICHICYKALYDAYSFRLKCLRSENLIGIYMREREKMSVPRQVRLEDVIYYWMTVYCTQRGSIDIAKENLVEWFGVHVLDKGETPASIRARLKNAEKLNSSIKTPQNNEKDVIESEVGNKILSTCDDNQTSESAQCEENTLQEEVQMEVVSIKKESEEGEGTEIQSLDVDPLASEAPTVVPFGEVIAGDMLPATDRKLMRPLIRVRKVSKSDYRKAKQHTLKQPKQVSHQNAGGFLKVKPSNLEGKSSPFRKLVLKQPLVGQQHYKTRHFLKNNSKPGTQLLALTLDQLNEFLRSNNLEPIVASESTSGFVTTPKLPSTITVASDDASVTQTAKESSTSSELALINVKEEPVESNEEEVPGNLEELCAWDSEDTLTGSDTSLVDRLLQDQMPILGDYEFDEPEYVSVTHVTNWRDMPILNPAVSVKQESTVPHCESPDVRETSVETLTNRIKEQITEKMTATNVKKLKRVIADEVVEELVAKKPKMIAKPVDVSQGIAVDSTSTQPTVDAELKDICVLYTNFTSEGSYNNDHDYLISPYLRNNLITYRAGKRMCICMLCDSAHPYSNHVKHMRSHSTKCIICNVDFKNVFILNLHVRGHTWRCFDCEVNVTYARYHHHQIFHPQKVLEKEKARLAEAKAEADSILKVLLAEKVDSPAFEVDTSQTNCSRKPRRSCRSRAKLQSSKEKAFTKKQEEITLLDLLKTSVKPNTTNVDLQLLSSATQNNTRVESVRKSGRKKKKRFYLGRRKNSKKCHKKKVVKKPKNTNDINSPVKSVNNFEVDAIKAEVKSNVLDSQTGVKPQTIQSDETIVQNKIKEICEEPPNIDVEAADVKPKFNKIPVKSSVLFESMTPIKIVKVDSNRIVVAPIGPVLTVKPNLSPDTSSKNAATKPNDDKTKSDYTSLLEKTEKHIQETRTLRKRKAIARSFRSLRSGALVRILPKPKKVVNRTVKRQSVQNVEVLDLKPAIKKELDPLS